MRPTLTVFARSPDRGQGLARDMPVRWALEEVGQDYDVRLVSFAEMRQPAHRARHPFAQIPTFEQDGLVLFESGAIVLHIAERHPGLLPEAADARTRAIGWMFAALSTMEPPIVAREERLPERLQQLAERLGTAEWLDGGFSAGDLMMVSVLRRLASSGLLQQHAVVGDYVARGEARPAFRRAFAAQRAVFMAASP